MDNLEDKNIKIGATKPSFSPPQTRSKTAQKVAEADREPKRFICGVVEGFYGRPWTSDQRRELFNRMEILKLNTYVYAPKDDLKHRAYWRELYTPEEADHLHGLIQGAEVRGVNFVYALSPGIDIVYSNNREVSLIKQKLEQVKTLGCRSFALLFDDIEPSMSEADKDKFTSFAQAQVSVTNEVFEYLGQPLFFFCPTEYCESRAVPSLESSEYLNLLGRKLLPKINILWTGPRVISRLISVEHVRRVSSVLKRPCTIWDNLHANDYDNRRVFLGPYMGRPTELKKEIAGVLTNPNCECEANFVAIHTLASWSKCHADASVEDETDATLEAGGLAPVAEEVTRRAKPFLLYHPVKAKREALDAWIPEFSAHRNAFGASVMPMKSPSALMVGINTCGSTTSTTSSNISLCGNTGAPAVYTAGTNPSTAPVAAGHPALHSGGPLYTTSGCSNPNSPSGPLPLYTPPAVVELVRNPFSIPPLVEEGGQQDGIQDHGVDPIMTPAMQAINSLTDEYCEPMEFASNVGSGTSASPILPRSSCAVQSVPSTLPKVFIATGALKQAVGEKRAAHFVEMGPPLPADPEQTKSTDSAKAVEGVAELMEAKSCEDLTQLDREKSLESGEGVVEDMVVEEREGKMEGLGQGGKSEQMQVDRDEGLGEESLTYAGEKRELLFSRQELELLVDLFYLPFENGPRGTWLLEEYIWLKQNANVLRRAKEEKNPELSEEWERRAVSFGDVCDLIIELYLRVACCPNRGLVYDLYPYLWDLQSVVSLLNTYVKWLSLGDLLPLVGPEIAISEMENVQKDQEDREDGKGNEKLDETLFPPPNECEPWLFRGGLVGGLQKLLPLEAGQDLFACRPPHPPVAQTFLIRNAVESDKRAIYELCKRTIDDGRDGSERFRNFPDLIGDRSVGAFFSHSPQYCFVMEVVDDDYVSDSVLGKIIGFGMAARDAQDFFQFFFECICGGNVGEVSSKFDVQ